MRGEYDKSIISIEKVEIPEHCDERYEFKRIYNCGSRCHEVFYDTDHSCSEIRVLFTFETVEELLTNDYFTKMLFINEPLSRFRRLYLDANFIMVDYLSGYSGIETFNSGFIPTALVTEINNYISLNAKRFCK